VTDVSSFNARGDAKAKIDSEVMLHRAYVALGNPFLVLQKVKSDDPVPLQAVKLLATYMQDPNNLENVSLQLSEWMTDPAAATDPDLLIAAAMIYNKEGKHEEALKYIHTATTLEMMAVLVHTYLQMDRIDLAEKQFKTMQQNEDDATLTQLAAAWVSLAKGGEKVQEALFIFTDLAEKYGTTITLLNGMAAANMSKGDYEDAEKLLQEAQSKNPNDADTLINLVVCLQHRGTSEELADSALSTLRTLHPKHAWVQKVAQLEDSFARVGGA